jgi:hypothetical protein
MWSRLWVTNHVHDLYRNSMDIVSVTKKNAVFLSRRKAYKNM